MNCNNLQEIEIVHANSFIYGDFLSYIGCLKTSYSMYIITDIDKLCEYLSMFKNLQSYDGYINKRIIHALGPIEKASLGLLTANIDIDDIPDSLEVMEFYIKDTNSSDILKRKPNIRSIWYSEDTLNPNSLLQMYPHVYFSKKNNDSKVINYNNKKLVTLEDLCLRVQGKSECIIL